MTYRHFPKITTPFLLGHPKSRQHAYQHAIEDLLDEILPAYLFSQELTDPADQELSIRQLNALLPLVKTSPIPHAVPAVFSFYALFPYQQGAFKFFFEMFSRWVVLGRRLNVILLYAVDFQMPLLSNQTYTLCDLTVQLESLEELEEIKRNLPVIESEVKLGVLSPYAARRILEMRGSTPDEKNAQIQEQIAYFIRRWPEHYGQDLYNEMQHLMIMTREEFRVARRAEHLTHLITLFYHFRRLLQKAIARDSQTRENKRRHIQLKVFRAHYQEGHRTQPVLCIAIGLNLVNEKELFSDRHVLKAVKTHMHQVKVVEGSSYTQRRNQEPLRLLYLEVAKNDGGRFNDDEITQLREILPLALCDRIEQLIHPVFMPRNEEEIMRNILQLSKQVNYSSDPPQIVISFDEQTYSHLSFLVTLVRVARPAEPSLEEKFKQSNTNLEFMLERCKTIGFLRKKYLKEAVVFRLRLKLDSFVRLDHTLDLNRARQWVVQEIERVLGPIRDYNGGMILKQHEALVDLKKHIGEHVKYSDLLLENFFYSLTPVLMRTTLETIYLKTLFMMLLNAVENQVVSGQENILNIQQREEYIFVIAITKELSFKDEFRKALKQCSDFQKEQVHSFVQIYDCFCWCYMLEASQEKQSHVCDLLKQAMQLWRQRDSCAIPISSSVQ